MSANPSTSELRRESTGSDSISVDSISVDSISSDSTSRALFEAREHIARDLHDVVIQRLLAVGMTLEGVNRSTREPATAALLSHAVDELEQVIKEIRTTIFGLQAPIDVRFASLRSRTTMVVDQAMQALGFVPSVLFEGAVDTTAPEALSDDVFAVLREALSNVARHARATQCDVVLSVTRDLLTLSVEDDGVGIVSIGRRSGLHNMEVRARARGGRLSITDREPRGTRLEWQVPPRPIRNAVGVQGAPQSISDPRGRAPC
jgi:signal transduction histidine kinase